MADGETMKMVREATDRLIAALEAGESDQLKAYLSAMGRFHGYSPGNVLLISIQFPKASRVAGYRAWQSLGRQVRKGEHGIRILAPIVCRNRDRDDDEDRVVAFKTASVFDVSQTEGTALPELAQTAGDPGELLGKLKTIIAAQGIELIYINGPAGLQGWSGSGQIAVRRGLTPAEEFSTTVHELAHSRLHEHEKSSRTVQETEAEAVAFVVCEAIGLDTNTAAVDYLRMYNGDRETLLASLNRIQRTAAGILADFRGSKAAGGEFGGPLSLAVQRSAA
jgi:antirestriction protein ArdC